MGAVAVRDSTDGVLAVLREAGRGDYTVRRYQVVLERFATFLNGSRPGHGERVGVHRLHREPDRGQVGGVA